MRWLLLLLVPLPALAICETTATQPPCWAGGPVVTLCTLPKKAWPGPYEWLVGSQVVAETPGPVVELPCTGTDPLNVKVRAKGGPSYSLKPIYCAAPWDANQDGRLSSTDTTRQSAIVSKRCSLGRKP